MTSKEKANELFNKYFLLNESATDENAVWIILALNKGLAKKTALIAVDEILNEFPKGFNGNFEMKRKLYWQEVKQEIENL